MEEKEKIVNEELIQKIKQCESGGIETARNKSSSAKGYFQFLDGTWDYYGKKRWGSNFSSKDSLNGKDNEELARWVIANFGAKDWDASKHCWDK